MLIFTNRELGDAPDESAFLRRFTPGGTRLAMANVARAPKGAPGTWAVSNVDKDVDDGDSLRALLPVFGGNRPVLVYLHGHQNPPGTLFERCERLRALYPVEVVGFSWVSEGCLPDGSELPGLVAPAPVAGESALMAVTDANRTDDSAQALIRRYRQSKTNAQDSVDALARFLRMVGTARLFANAQPFTLAAHSLGSHFLQYTLEVPGAGESLGTAFNVALLAPCTRASGHPDWLARIRPKNQVFVTFNRSDSVLFGARVADAGQVKLGADPGPERLSAPQVRYIDFSDAAVGVGGHSYFALRRMPKAFTGLFSRILGSAPDLQPGENPSAVYPMGCDSDGLTCHMAASAQPVP